MALTESQKLKIEAEEQYRAQVRQKLEEPEDTPAKGGGCLKTLITAFFLFPATIVFFPVTIALAFSKRINRSGAEHKKLLSAAVLALGVIVTVALYGGAYQQGKTQEMLRRMPHPVTQQEKTDFESFYREFMRIGRESDNANEVIVKNLGALSEGRTSSATVYVNAKTAEKNLQGLSLQMTTLSVPESLSPGKEKLNAAKDKMSMSIAVRADAMKSIADFMNTGDYEKAYRLNEKVQTQQELMLDALASVLAVAKKLNIDVDQIK